MSYPPTSKASRGVYIIISICVILCVIVLHHHRTKTNTVTDRELSINNCSKKIVSIFTKVVLTWIFFPIWKANKNLGKIWERFFCHSYISVSLTHTHTRTLLHLSLTYTHTHAHLFTLYLTFAIKLTSDVTFLCLDNIYNIFFHKHSCSLLSIWVLNLFLCTYACLRLGSVDPNHSPPLKFCHINF